MPLFLFVFNAYNKRVKIKENDLDDLLWLLPLPPLT